MNKPERLLACFCLLAVMVFLVPGPTARAQAPIVLRVSTNMSSIDSAALEAARAKGFFTAEGIDVDTTPVAGGAAGLPALAAGQIQIASSNIISIILGAKQGLGFKIVAAGDMTRDAPPDLAGMIAKPGSGIKNGKDLAGKKLAVNTRNNIIWLYARAWVEATGGDANQITYLEVPFPQMVDAVRNGLVDAAFVVEPFLSVATDAHLVKVIGWPYSDVQKRIPISEFAATQSYIDAHPDIIARFARGYNRGVDWLNEHQGQPEWFDLISSYTHIAADKLRNVSPPVFAKVIDPGQIEQVAALMKRHDLLKGNFDVRSILYPTVLK